MFKIIIRLLLTAVIAAALTGVTLTGCVTPEQATTSITRQTGARTEEVSFDTSLTREQYVILDTVAGEGTVRRIQVERRNRTRQLFSLRLPQSYYVLDYDRSLGSWVDEEPVDADFISDRAMSAGEADLLRRMEIIAARVALYNALEANPEADAVLSPRYRFVYEMGDQVVARDLIVARRIDRVTAHMTGMAVRIKSDEELYQTYREFPGLANKTDQ